MDDNKYYQKTKVDDGGHCLITGTQSLKSLHQQFISVINHKMGGASSHVAGSTVDSSNLSFSQHQIFPTDLSLPSDSNSLYSNKLKYNCYRIVPSLDSSNNPDEDWMKFDTKTIIRGQFVFEGFTIITQQSLDKLLSPLHGICRDFNKIIFISLKQCPQLPHEWFVIQDLRLFNFYLFEVLFNIHLPFDDSLQIHLLPIFKNKKDDTYASMATIFKHLIESSKAISLKSPRSFQEECSISDQYTDHLTFNPHKHPCTLRVDKLEWRHKERQWFIVHYCHIVEPEDNGLPSMRGQHHKPAKSRKEYFDSKYDSSRKRRRNHEEELYRSCDGHITTGLYSDVAHHALLLPCMFNHIKYHRQLTTFEQNLGYIFQNRSLLQRALTHPSCINIDPDSSCDNPLSVCHDYCGPRTSRHEKNDGRWLKRPRKVTGLEELSAVVNAPRDDRECRHGNIETNKNTAHNERLEFLGDAVIELITSYHLFHMFPNYSDGQLVIFRKALICNEYLGQVAKNKLNVDEYILTGVCGLPSEIEERIHIRANALEAVIGAVYLDGGLDQVKEVLARLYFPEKDLYDVWISIKPHPLKQEFPEGDRHLVSDSALLQKLTELEDSIGVNFNNICLLGKAFTHPSFGYTNLFRGHYQRLEFLGDAILQFITSVHMYKTFPTSHEGHLTAFRMAVVHNKQLAKVSEELGFVKYIFVGKEQVNSMTTKIKADVIESFLAALYLDKGAEYAEKFCNICLFPKLEEGSKGLQFLDPKSRLQHALVYTCKKRSVEVVPPYYRVLSVTGVGNNRKCTVGVYFKKQRLAVGTGQSNQKAEMDAAEKAILNDIVLVPKNLQKH